MRCVFCDDGNVRARKIFDNGLALAFPSSMPITPGHVLVVPKRHAATMNAITQEERIAVLDLGEKIKTALKKVFGAGGFNVAYNEGKVAGQNVGHFHMHIVPRTENDGGIVEYEPRKFLYRTGSRGETPQEELLQVAALIRTAV